LAAPITSDYAMTMKEIADLIESSEARQLASGNYLNRRGARGYYLQIKYADYWCKNSISHADRHSDRLTIGELDAIIPQTLETVVLIPLSSISAALRSITAEHIPLKKYVNSAAVEGVWAEFYCDPNWYMVSVSHIDVPPGASPDKLDRIADEFLRQQDFPKNRKRRFEW